MPLLVVADAIAGTVMRNLIGCPPACRGPRDGVMGRDVAMKVLEEKMLDFLRLLWITFPASPSPRTPLLP